MKSGNKPLKFIAPGALITLIVAVGLALLFWPRWQSRLFYITGEEEALKQFSGGIQYLFTRLQPPLKTADMVPVQHADMAPYGVNTFLQQEVEPEKRELAMKMVAEGGFRWIRQEFTWEDIEIHGKDDFEDRRNPPSKSAWGKYDHIVDLSEKYDVQIMARLSNPPAWTRAEGNDAGAFAPPDNVKDFGDFVEAVAQRYKGRIHVYQLWNEPNIYPEWGAYPINAIEYVALLKEGYTRIKAVDPDAVVVMGALAATIELDRQRREGISPGGLSDVLFLQQVYDAGGADYFDVLAMQGYGLWSGPYDRRMQPRVLNFSRPLYIRDVMVRNGDAHKAIWLSEMAWNATPPDSGIPAVYGSVSPEQQAAYAALAYERIQKEWAWLGVANYWFLKQATDQELQDGNPQYFFRLLEPDFSPMPVYEALKETNNQPPMMHLGYHQEDHWAIHYSDGWQRVKDPYAVLGSLMQTTEKGATLDFTFWGSGVTLVAIPGVAGSQLQVQINGQEPTKNIISAGEQQEPVEIALVDGLEEGPHYVSVTLMGDGEAKIDGFIVHNTQGGGIVGYIGLAVMALLALTGLGWITKMAKRIVMDD